MTRELDVSKRATGEGSATGGGRLTMGPVAMGPVAMDPLIGAVAIGPVAIGALEIAPLAGMLMRVAIGAATDAAARSATEGAAAGANVEMPSGRAPMGRSTGVMPP